MKAKMSPLTKAAATINRLASGAPKGRSESDSPSKMARARAEAAKKNKKAPARSVDKPGSGVLAKRRAATIKKGLGEY